jgi:hypothetical protein
MPLAVTFRFMLFEHSSRSYFVGPVTVAPRPLRTLLDMFILPLFFSAHNRVDVFSLAFGTFLQRYLWFFNHRSSNPVWQYRKPLSLQRYYNGSPRPQHV